MLPSILSQGGNNLKGACSVQIVPIQAIANPIVIDPIKGAVTSPVQLRTGWNWIELGFIPITFKYNSKFVTTKGKGSYSISVSGTINNPSADNISTLDLLRYARLVVLIYNRDGSVYIIGNEKKGMRLSFDHYNETEGNNANSIPVTLSMESAKPAAFYTVNG